MSVNIPEHSNLVGGDWVDAVDGGMMDVINPATEELIARVPRGTQADVDRAVAAAAAALPAWLDTTPGERAEMLLGLADRLDEHAEELIAMESLNVGKPRSVAEPEIPFCSDNLRFFAGAARCQDGRVHRRVPARIHLDAAPRASRRGRADRPLELPADDGRVEDRPGACRRKRRRPEAAPSRRR